MDILIPQKNGTIGREHVIADLHEALSAGRHMRCVWCKLLNDSPISRFDRIPSAVNCRRAKSLPHESGRSAHV